MAKRIIKLTETELNRIIQKVISEQQTLRTSNLQAPEDMDPNPMQKPKSDFGLKNPGAPKFMPSTPESIPVTNNSTPNTSGGLKTNKTPTTPIGVLSPDLYKGSKGSEVSKFQSALSTLGYGTKPDGIFGPITQTAIMNFQQANGLKPTGRIDKATGDLILSKAGTVNKVSRLGDPLKNAQSTPPPLIAKPKASAPPPKNPASSSTQKLGYGGGGGWLSKKLRQR